MSTTADSQAPRQVLNTATRRVLAALRILLAWLFLWPFFDATFGLNYGTPPERAWVRGGSPTTGFLGHLPEGPFRGIFSQLSGVAIVDWVFMFGLLAIGTALLLGIGLKITAISATVLLFCMYLALFPLGHDAAWSAANGVKAIYDPITDVHWLEALGIILVCLTRAGDTWGLGRWWASRVGDRSILR